MWWATHAARSRASIPKSVSWMSHGTRTKRSYMNESRLTHTHITRAMRVALACASLNESRHSWMRHNVVTHSWLIRLWLILHNIFVCDSFSVTPSHSWLILDYSFVYNSFHWLLLIHDSNFMTHSSVTHCHPWLVLHNSFVYDSFSLTPSHSRLVLIDSFSFMTHSS